MSRDQYPITVELEADYNWFKTIPGVIWDKGWYMQVLGDVPFFHVHFRSEDDIERFRDMMKQYGVKLV